MTEKPDPYQQVIDTAVKNWAVDYANLPSDDFTAHERAIELARQQRRVAGTKDERDFNKKISMMSNAEFDRKLSFNDWS